MHRALSRKAKRSNNRAKTRRKVARQHAKVADARREFCHQLSTQIIRENPTVVVEDLAVSGLARTRLATSVHDAGWSAFTGMRRSTSWPPDGRHSTGWRAHAVSVP
ncbi:transposase [Nonomuraea diastatica]|uniref:transposase n=1 Tax=Nonomuraea diastatica TaxID=1848329 RepID=UPI0026AA4FBA